MKKTPKEMIDRIMRTYATGSVSVSDVARTVGMPVSTVYDVIKNHENDAEYKKLIEEYQRDFISRTDPIISDAICVLERRLRRAKECETELDAIIEIFKNEKELSTKEKSRLIGVLESLKIDDIRELTSSMATIIDKQMLFSGRATSRVEFISDETVDKLAQLAGYSKN